MRPQGVRRSGVVWGHCLEESEEGVMGWGNVGGQNQGGEKWIDCKKKIKLIKKKAKVALTHLKVSFLFNFIKIVYFCTLSYLDLRHFYLDTQELLVYKWNVIQKLLSSVVNKIFCL